MPEQDDQLSDALQDYYQRMAQQPAPDVTGAVMMSAEAHARRRRTWTAIAGGVAAAAVVGAVIAVALVNHKSPSAVAPGHSPTPSPTATGPTASPSPTSPSPTVAPGPVGPPGGPVPPGFTAVSVTFVSPDEGWVLGTAPCSKSPCTSILRTRDGGATWHGVPAPRISLRIGTTTGIIRFADPANGWVGTGVALEATHDGGATWHSVSLPNVQPNGIVNDIETASGVVDATALESGGTEGLYHATVGSDSWSLVNTAPASEGGYGRLSLAGTHGWLVLGAMGILVTTDGTTWHQHASPCPSQDSVGIAAASATTVYAVCTSNGSAGGAMVSRTVVVSHDGGQSFQVTAPPPQTGDFDGISATPDGHTVALSVSTPGPGSIQVSSDSGAHFRVAYSADQTGGAGFSDLGFTTDSQGVVVLAPGQSGVLFMTRDGGWSWRAIRF